MTQPAATTIARHLAFMSLDYDPDGLGEQFVGMLAELTVERSFAPGDVLIDAGSRADTLVLVTEGEVHQEHGPPLPSHAFLHGLDAAVVGGFYRRTLVAISAGRALTVAAKAFFALLEDQFSTALTVLVTFAQRLEAMRGVRSRTGPCIAVGSSAVDWALALRQCPELSFVSAQGILSLARRATSITLAAGEAATQSASQLYVELDGALCSTHLETRRNRDHSGLGLVNVAATFAGGAGYELVATSPTRLLLLDRQEIVIEMRSDFALWRSLVAAMIAETALLDP